MTLSAELLALQQICENCRLHESGLRDALDDLALRALCSGDLASLGKEDRRLLDQFAYRYLRLQDDMGARLMPAVLRALGEEVASMAALDRFARLEQLGWLPSAEEWSDLRRVRNEFAHDYPETDDERFARLQLAIASAHRALQIWTGFQDRVRARWPGS